MQQYAGVYLLQNYPTCFGCPSHLSPGVHKTVTAASDTGRCSDTMTCIRSCSYSFMQVFIYCKITLYVSGAHHTYHQEYIKL